MTEELSINKEESESHLEIQYKVAKLGSDLGFDIWIANTDKNKSFQRNSFKEIKRILVKFPHISADDITNKTIENIDVLWLKNNYPVYSFEVEHTTSIYSGLLRITDLLCRNPLITIISVIVYPDDRKNKVIEQINRPTFDQFDLKNKCKIISYTKLKEMIKNDISTQDSNKFMEKMFKEENSVESSNTIAKYLQNSELGQEKKTTAQFRQKTSLNRMDFFNKYSEFLKNKNSDIKTSNIDSKGRFITIKNPSKQRIYNFLKEKEIGCGISVEGKNWSEKAKSIQENKENINKEFEENIEWRLNNSSMGIRLLKKSNFSNKEKFEENCNWLENKTKKFINIFEKYAV